MAAPTSVRVESTSITTNVIRWVYGGANAIAVYRAPFGGAFAEITSLLNGTRVAVGTLSYTDTTAVPGTRYEYKLSDDSGSTFSSTVNVVTQACLSSSSQLSNLSLPRFEGQEQQDRELNDLAERVEAALSGQILDVTQCVACPENGSVVIDCSGGCHEWVVIADEDINSVSIQWCQGSPLNVEFVVPPNTTNRRICGFPAGFGFTGDECTDFPITTGSQPRTIGMGSGPTGRANPAASRARPGAGGGGARGGGSGGTTCSCVPGAQGQLTIKCCTANCSMSCSGGKALTLLVCGGIGPYTFSVSGGTAKFEDPDGTQHTAVEVAEIGNTGFVPAVKVVPPANAGSAEAGVAYRDVCCACDSLNTNDYVYSERGCNDQVITACTALAATANMTCANGDITSCCNQGGLCCNGDGTGGSCSCGAHTSGVSPCTRCGGTAPGGYMCDVRTAGQIAAGCVPCGIGAGGTVVTVTDNTGTATSITLRA